MPPSGKPKIVYIEQADLYLSGGEEGARALEDARKKIGESETAIVSRPGNLFPGEKIVPIYSFNFSELAEKFPDIPDGLTVEIGGNHLEIEPASSAFGIGAEYARELSEKYPGGKIVLLRQCVSQAGKDISRVLLRRGKTARILIDTSICVRFGGDASLWEGLPKIEYLGSDERNGYGRILG